LYQDVYQGKGGILGWMQWTNDAVSGTAVWIVPGSLQPIQITGEPSSAGQAH
jgi:hypothetical protein